MRWLYTLIFALALPWIFLRLIIRSLKLPAYRKRLLERLGIYTNFFPATNGIWIHAVSVGEVVAALPLIKALQQRSNPLPITVTTTTPTGSQRVLQSLDSTVFHVYLPYDIPWALKGLIKKLQPSCLIIMETELWPNLLHECSRQQIPVIIANGRISDRSFKGYLRFKWFIANILRQVTLVAAQSATDAARFVQLGLEPQKVQVAGNLKFEVQPNSIQQKQGITLKNSIAKRKIWVAASTHANEEEMVLQAYKKIKQQIPELLLILVPRHPDRFNTVANLLQQHNYNFVRHSSSNAIVDATEIILGDTMGELQMFYAAADIAFVGGSLVPVGGHNLLEPAMFGVPSITGPNTENFKDITKLLFDAGAIRIVPNVTELAPQIFRLLQQPELLKEMGQKARAVVLANNGAAATICQFLAQGKYLPAV